MYVGYVCIWVVEIKFSAQGHDADRCPGLFIIHTVLRVLYLLPFSSMPKAVHAIQCLLVDICGLAQVRCSKVGLQFTQLVNTASLKFECFLGLFC